MSSSKSKKKSHKILQVETFPLPSTLSRMTSIWELANPQLREIDVYEPGKPIEETARELGVDPEAIIKLASNENPRALLPRRIGSCALPWYRSSVSRLQGLLPAKRLQPNVVSRQERYSRQRSNEVLESSVTRFCLARG